MIKKRSQDGIAQLRAENRRLRVLLHYLYHDLAQITSLLKSQQRNIADRVPEVQSVNLESDK